MGHGPWAMSMQPLCRSRLRLPWISLRAVRGAVRAAPLPEVKLRGPEQTLEAIQASMTAAFRQLLKSAIDEARRGAGQGRSREGRGKEL